MSKVIDALLRGGPVVTDGAWGTQLLQRGLASGDCPDHWNLTHPELVAEVPRAYVDAGSKIVLTNTFRANRIALADYNLADQAEAINSAAAAISLRAAGDGAKVFGSIGPSGKMLMMGETSEEALADAFLQQAIALANAGVCGLVVETMSDLAEAKIALAAAKGTGLPVVACMVFDSGKSLDRTMMGDSVARVAEELTDAGADVVGANCGQGIASYVEICNKLRSATSLPIWIKANAGIPEVDDGKVVYRTDANEFGSYAAALVNAGAQFIGGCCGTGPEYIRALVANLKKRS